MVGIRPAEVAGASVPECRLFRITAYAVQAHPLKKRRVEGYGHLHRGFTVTGVRGALEEGPSRNNIARAEKGVAARHQRGGLDS
jgi:hypothetical protein